MESGLDLSELRALLLEDPQQHKGENDADADADADVDNTDNKVFRQKCAKIILQLYGIIDQDTDDDEKNKKDDNEVELKLQIEEYLIDQNLLSKQEIHRIQSTKGVWNKQRFHFPHNQDCNSSRCIDDSKDSRTSSSITMMDLAMPITRPSLTTIVSQSSLPKYQRGNYLSTCTSHTSQEDNDDLLVEIFKHDLAANANDESSNVHQQQIPSQRPLSGNLSSKLVEYTRGQVGHRKPFQPGGFTRDDDDNVYDGNEKTKNKSANDDEDIIVPYCSPKDLKNAMDVIDIYNTIDDDTSNLHSITNNDEKNHIINAWNNGTLLTAPPGVSFDVGLSIHDFSLFDHDDNGKITIGELGCHKKNQEGTDDDEHGNDAVLNTKSSSNQEEETEQSNLTDSRGFAKTNASTVSKMWDKSYFEEDSLFGDSADDSDDDFSSEDGGVSESSDSEYDMSDDYDNKETKRKESNDVDDTKNEAKATNNEDDNDDDIDDIDQFLSELEQTKTNQTTRTLTSSSSTKNKVKKTMTFMNQKISVQEVKERKCWAVTTSLNLENFHSIVPKPAITYSFELDGFQKQAVARIERGECIFVAAHTSAGKTVCAEYAIALARKHCTRAIYTSPIKALSNQKYRDFRDKFGDDVGLITGDLQINADSSCLIMTTEILRSMLYRGADLIRDIEWVIFDEVHYINDTERGVVWEEVIIMLPDYVNMIFLSATTPNTIDFSDWIGRTKRKPVHVIRTNYRPVPLSHYLYAGLKLHKIMEGNSGFLNKGYSQASKALLPASERENNQQNTKKKGPMGGSKQTSAPSYRKSSGSTQSAWQQSGNRQNWTSLVKFLERESLMPTVVFSFSKKKCEEIANMLSTLDLNTTSERNTAHAFSIQTMARLSPKDAALPQVLATCEMVKRGIGVHHGGLLPILKEMVEILFSKGLVKVLFATETFAMGVNMPARAVVFNSIRKHDGTKFRVLEPGEYTQMAGRAGRRGLDKVGTVIMCCFGDEPPPQLVLRQMLTGSSTKLQSQFRLTYNMIMNLLRVEDMTVEGMIKRSFSEFATQRALTTNEYPKLLKRGLKALSKLDERFENNSEYLSGETEDIQEYFHKSATLLGQNKNALSYLIGCASSSAGGSLVAGRIIFITAARKKGYVKAPAIILKPPAVSTNTNDVSNLNLVCMVLCPKSFVKPVEDNKIKEGYLNFVGESRNRYYAIKQIDFDEILTVTNLKHKIETTRLYSESSVSSKKSFGAFGKHIAPRRREVDDFGGFSGMKALKQRGNKDFGPSTGDQDQLIDQAVKFLKDAEEKECAIDPIDFIECTKGARQGEEAFQFRSLAKQITENVYGLRTYQSHYSQKLLNCFITVERKETLRRDVEILRHLLSNESLQLFPDFLQRKALLRTLNYIDDNDTVCVKGRVACEVNTCEEIIVTELIFEGILNELEPQEIVAVLSALIFQEKTTESELDSELPERLRNACDRMKTIATNLGQMQSDHGIQLVAKDYCESSLKFGLVHVVYEWASGVPFNSICELTLVQEGSIVRTITRLDELCREVRNCSRIVGNPILYRKMEEASVAIKRDIVFASSLYI